MAHTDLKTLLLCLLACLLFSCEETEPVKPLRPTGSTSFQKKAAMEQFAKILSRATYEHKEVREFLKAEALEEFDLNNDILYATAKDKKKSDQK